MWYHKWYHACLFSWFLWQVTLLTWCRCGPHIPLPNRRCGSRYCESDFSMGPRGRYTSVDNDHFILIHWYATVALRGDWQRHHRQHSAAASRATSGASCRCSSEVEGVLVGGRPHWGPSGTETPSFHFVSFWTFCSKKAALGLGCSPPPLEPPGNHNPSDTLRTILFPICAVMCCQFQGLWKTVHPSYKAIKQVLWFLLYL